MIVKVLKTDERAVMPFKKHESDFCYDMTAISRKRIAPFVWKYEFGLAFQIEREKDELGISEQINLSIDGRPRSSVWKTGMILSNCIATIDEGYTGSVSAVFFHVLPWMRKYKVGERVLQIKIGITEKISFVEVKSLDKTLRGDGSYGSTGK